MDFDKVYKEIVHYENIDVSGTEIESHGKTIQKTDRVCLFCGNSTPNVTFSRIAHAISETAGNKRLVNHFECDECNLAFGKVLEDSLGKYLAPLKYVSRIFGKKGSLTIKDNPTDTTLSYGSYRLESTKDRFAIDDAGQLKNYIVEKSGTGIYKEIEGGFSLQIPRQKYNPRLVYAALLKMAYSIMPLELLDDYIKGMLLIQAYVKKSEPFTSQIEGDKYLMSLPNVGIFVFFPGYNPLSGLTIHLYQKQSNALAEYPKMLFQLDFVNFILLIPIKSDSENGNFRLLYPNFKNASTISPVDFNIFEEFFTCEFSAKKISISETERTELESKLRKEGLLKAKDNAEQT